MKLETLKSLDSFVCWKYELDKSCRRTKVPYSPKDGLRVGSTEAYRHRWGNYPLAGATQKAEQSGPDGIGIVFTKAMDNLYICGIDIDGRAEQDAEVQTILAMFPNAYIERIPSGNGIHIIFLVDISRVPTKETTAKDKRQLVLDPKYYSKNPSNKVEVYVAGLTNRYFTFTEDILQDGNDTDQTKEFLQFLDMYMVRGANGNERSAKYGGHSSDGNNQKFAPSATGGEAEAQDVQGLSDDELLTKARSAANGTKFTALFDIDDVSGYHSESNADQALCNILAFWTRCDKGQMERLFSMSELGKREKWREREDYRRMTIDKAVSDCSSMYEPRPATSRTAGEKSGKKDTRPTLSEAVLVEYLAMMGITLRYNVINKSVEIKGVASDYNPETLQNDLPIIIHDALKSEVKRCDKSAVQDMLGVIAGKNRFNPVTEMLESAAWDKQDKFSEFCALLHIPETDILSRTLLYKWLWLGLSMARNELEGACGADGVLMLQGDQRLGKTSVARKLAVRADLCKLSQHLDSRDEDTYRRAVNAWIVEFGEIETTFRSDLERLKAFITNERDEYRLPYGRADQVLARRTVIIGTCNSEKFLIDPTGSRRFWTVPVKNINLDALAKFDA
ncbi:MAG: hypothetical protein FWB93_06115, partial [Oscillospiraceae bacterium]|nr:hypothetical protein [Oscillospiraceae bacterium]